MTDIAPITTTNPLAQFAVPAAVADPNANDLDKDAFLQLLVAQLRYQDPLNPNDPAEFMATTAQFTVVEKLDELTQQGENTAIISGLSMASSLVGRTVTYVGGDDAVTTGLVSSAQVSNGEVTLVTDNGAVDLSTVIGIGAAAGADAPTAPVVANEPVGGDAGPVGGDAESTGGDAEPVAAPAPAPADPAPVADDVSSAPAAAAPDIPGIPDVAGLPASPVAIPTSRFSSRPEGVPLPET